jgi:hypothetical protein
LLGGRDPRHLVRTETSAALHRNRTGQILGGIDGLPVIDVEGSGQARGADFADCSMG